MGSLGKVLFVVIAILFVAVLDRFGPTIDLTREEVLTIAPQTKAVVDALSEDLTITAFYRLGDKREKRVRELLDMFARENSRIAYRIVDPDRFPGEAGDRGVKVHGETILEYGGRESRVYNYGEAELAAAIRRLIHPEKRTVRFVTGIGGPAPTGDDPRSFGMAIHSLSGEGVDVGEIVLATVEEIPDSVDLLVLSAPTSNAEAEQFDQLERWIRGGGKMLLLLDPGTSRGWDEFAERFGMTVDQNVVVDRSSRLYGADMQMPVVIDYDIHDATRGLEGTTVFAHARSVSLAGSGKGGGEVRSLIHSSADAWGERDIALLRSGKAVFNSGRDDDGPVALAMIASVPTGDGISARSPFGRLAVFGDSDFGTNRFFGQGVNGELFLRMVRWLSGRGEIAGAGIIEDREELLLLTLNEGRALFLLFLFVMPGVVAVTGTTLLLYRRSRR